MSQHIHANVIIIGGGTGGCAAALAAARSGQSVVMTEAYDWIGGQLTSQAVPPDESRWIEQFGCTASYRAFRDGVRDYYRRFFPLTEQARARTAFNPGNAWVSRLSHEPRTALAVLQNMLAPYVHSGKLRIWTGYHPISAETEGDDIRSIKVKGNDGDTLILTGQYFIDATEEGDVLPLAGVEYVTGAESITDTGEPHALAGAADPQDMQAFTHCLAMDYTPGENYTISKPKEYNFWKDYQADFWPAPQLSWTVPSPQTLEPVTYALMPGEASYPLWTYRRIVDKANFLPGTYSADISIINYPQNDYWLGSIIDVPAEERKRHLRSAKQLTLSLLYWMQTEAPRADGGIGYPGLRPRPDVTGAEDGLAQAPYIRESRRIHAEFTILEQHLNPDCRTNGKAEVYPDSVGIGSYRIDLHPSTSLRSFIDVSSLPFQIPLGALLPVRVNNLLPAAKNIGTTHITNGCYRLHPVEWNIGEAAGMLTAFCIERNVQPRAVRNTPDLLQAFQTRLKNNGFELTWPSIGAV
ncbi:FAD-dependent oxidoreductase [Paenibacillus sp. IHBB 10380]|uniref:FAD-dependent oxidoreductase n=1 Tax=Paenibacillus sp. IHBB 10380 TaxID=1566358 RepID=UPI0005CF9E41|nr:FAD-dependent oxidoreductase [Paenibacillus sp. IHBB 10380]AJS60945.1 FAD-dependent oxidoreductase [Paenibacillus sp. IHBB 10380]